MSSETRGQAAKVRVAILCAILCCAGAVCFSTPVPAATQADSDAESNGMGMGGMGGGMGGTGTVIDPPVGAPFHDPPEMGNASTTPGVVQATVEVKLTEAKAALERAMQGHILAQAEWVGVYRRGR